MLSLSWWKGRSGARPSSSGTGSSAPASPWPAYRDDPEAGAAAGAGGHDVSSADATSSRPALSGV
jgi:hypothetical protein